MGCNRTGMAAARPAQRGLGGGGVQPLTLLVNPASVNGKTLKLLLGLAVPYDGDLTCEHLDALSPSAYRCGQVWGISIEVAGVRFYHQGSANLIDADVTPDAHVLLRRHKQLGKRKMQNRLMNVLFPRIPLWDPDRFTHCTVDFFLDLPALAGDGTLMARFAIRRLIAMVRSTSEPIVACDRVTGAGGAVGVLEDAQGGTRCLVIPVTLAEQQQAVGVIRIGRRVVHGRSAIAAGPLMIFPFPDS